jgi:hypothetical protein
MLFSGLSALSLLVAYARKKLVQPARTGSLVAAGLYALFSFWLLYYGFRDQAGLLPWLGGVVAFAMIGYWLSSRSPGANATGP